MFYILIRTHNRVANFAAHHLAKLAAHMGMKRKWLKEILD
jgi:hypothetical protein